MCVITIIVLRKEEKYSVLEKSFYILPELDCDKMHIVTPRATTTKICLYSAQPCF